MAKEEKKQNSKPTALVSKTGKPGGDKNNFGANKSVYAKKKFGRNQDRRKSAGRNNRKQEDFDQRIVDIARVTRVMAGGKRMRFRACVALGDKKGKIALGMAKGADVTIAVTKAVNKAKKDFIEVPVTNDTIPHEIYQKLGAAKVLLKPARRGKGLIAGGAVRTVLELSGIRNITSKNLGTNNKVNVAKCVVEALKNLKRVEKIKRQDDKKKIETDINDSGKKENNK